MSYYITSTEELTIRNENKAANKAVEALAEYINLFNHMDCARYMSIYDLVLTADDKEFKISSFDSSKEATYFYGATEEDGENEFGFYEEEITFWPDDSEFMVFVNKLKEAKLVKFSISHNEEVFALNQYGSEFWEKFFKENDCPEMRETVVYKEVEFYDSWVGVTCFKYAKDYAGYVHYESKKEDVVGVENWWDDQFYTGLIFEEDAEIPQKAYEEFKEICHSFYQSFCVDPDFEYEERDFYIDGQLEIPFEKTDDYIDHIKRLFEMSKKYNAKFKIESFMSACGGYDFAAFTSYVEDDELKFGYCYF